MRQTILKYVLYDGMNTEGQLFRVKKDYIVRFVLDVSLVGKHVRLFVNYPDLTNPFFVRSYYQELKMQNPTITKNKLDCFDDYFEFPKITVCGAFHFYFSKDGSAPSPPSDGALDDKIAGSGYIIVDPDFKSRVHVSEDDNKLNLDGIVLQTYLSKNLGYFNDWESRLRTAIEGNYNMIHFTPLQELGYSRSAYSLKDQLKVNPEFTPPGETEHIDWSNIENFIKRLENNFSIVSMTDLVFNHTANNSPWVHEHPECAYNVVNSPHLAPAYILDYIVWKLTLEAGSGLLKDCGIPSTLQNPDTELPAMRYWLTKQIEDANLSQFFMADVELISDMFKRWLLSGKPLDDECFVSNSLQLFLTIGGPRKGKRFGATVDFKVARQEFVGTVDHQIPVTESDAESATVKLKSKLLSLNEEKRNEISHHLHAAVNNILANAYYRFYDPFGLKLGTVTVKSPIMWMYFYHPIPDLSTVQEAEAVLETKHAEKIMAFNGWVMNDDPLRNFAESSSFVYLRRELVVWGDSVKLRYGNKPEDCPYLWDRMVKYTELTARIFHAVRLDNCHSTPLHVAQYMLDRARAIRPNLYVVAELFTGGEYLDNIFINKLGINSLIREALSSNDCHDFGRQIHRYGATIPAGAFLQRPGVRRLYPTIAHALLYDQTHDNESIMDKHCLFDYLPLTAICSFASCAIGSTRGYDELVPHYVDVVKEERKYAKWPEQVNGKVGLIKAKSILNEIHQWLSTQCFTETFVDQVTPNILAVTRFCPHNREAVMLIAHSAFKDVGAAPYHVDFKPVQLSGHVNRILCEILVNYDGPYPPAQHFTHNSEFINGLLNVKYSIVENISAKESRTFHIDDHSRDEQQNTSGDKLVFHNFPPGSVLIISIRLNETQQQAVADLHSFITEQFDCRLFTARTSMSMGKGENAYTPIVLPERSSAFESNSLRSLLSDLNFVELNKALFRCGSEENYDGTGYKNYNIPGWGTLAYCGFQSITADLDGIRDRNDLGHPICNHLREGDWLVDYLTNRLLATPCNSTNLLTGALKEVGGLLKTMYNPLKDLPRYLVPSYFEIITSRFSELLGLEIILRMAPWVSTSSSLVKRLAVATTQFYGYIANARLPCNIISGKEMTHLNNTFVPMYRSLAAGLPHFAEGMWRSWGRDTFIALRGCLLLPGRFQEAADLIISYGSLLRHGLIPNLTGDGYSVQPRYNCRDAVWYWLYSIICYEQAIRDPDAHASSQIEGPLRSSILYQQIQRWFPTDDAEGWPVAYTTSKMNQSDICFQPLHEIMQEALQSHASGICFMERNAGPGLDEFMRPEGFKVQASIDPNTHFPRGGNAFNCGTWMDKMGSSEKAGNKGIPATPRDGSAVELVGLAYAIAKWLATAHNTPSAQPGHYPHNGIQLSTGKFITWKDWADKISDLFEALFWIPDDTNDPKMAYNRGIYKDCVGSSSGYTDNQLRPNFLITMVVAPEIFTLERAWNALEIVKKELVGPLGMRTLSKKDLAYRGYYDNANDSDDYSVARGFNYHQGPEWLWPVGFYLRARLKFARSLAKTQPDLHQRLVGTINECQQMLANLDKALQSNTWRSLPELTNLDGQPCPDSCCAQAWSVGCIMEAAYDLTSA